MELLQCMLTFRQGDRAICLLCRWKIGMQPLNATAACHHCQRELFLRADVIGRHCPPEGISCEVGVELQEALLAYLMTSILLGVVGGQQ